MSELAKRVLKELFLNELEHGKPKEELMIFDCTDVKLRDFPEIHELYIDYCIRIRNLVDIGEFQKYIWDEVKDERIRIMYIKCLGSALKNLG